MAGVEEARWRFDNPPGYDFPILPVFKPLVLESRMGIAVFGFFRSLVSGRRRQSASQAVFLSATEPFLSTQFAPQDAPPNGANQLRFALPMAPNRLVTHKTFLEQQSRRAARQAAPLRVLHVCDAGSRSGRWVISGRMADVCAELDRLVECERLAC